YAPHAAAMTTDMRTLEGAPWEACPRAFLKRQIAACAAAGFSVRGAYECEFSLAVKRPDGGFAPLDESLCFSTVGMTTAAPVMDDIVAALEAQRTPGEQDYPELAPGGRVRPAGREPLLLHRRDDDRGAGDGRHRGRARGAAHSGRAVLPGAGPRPAGAVDRACAGARSRRPPRLLSGDGAGRRPPSRALGLARAQALPRPGRQRRAHPLEPLGHRGPPLAPARP